MFSALLSAPAAAAEYVIDPVHSGATFAVEHFGVTFVPGRFDKTTGKITLDREKKQGSIDVEIDTTSVNTGTPARDALLKSDEYFNVAKFPTIAFHADKLRFDGERLVAADGHLTILGVIRAVSLNVSAFKCVMRPNNRELCGAVATTTFRRSDFGMIRASRNLGDDVNISIHVEARTN